MSSPGYDHDDDEKDRASSTERRGRVTVPLDDATRVRLDVLHDEAKLDEVAEGVRTGLYGGAPFSCLGCGTGIRRPRLIRESGSRRRYVTLAWCGEPCRDAWLAKHRVPPMRYAIYDGDPQKGATLVGFFLPKHGRISVEEIEAAQVAADDTEVVPR